MATVMILGKEIKEENLQKFTKQLFKNRQKDRRIDRMEKMTKEKFKAYVEVQEAGVTNMFNLKNVIAFAEEFCDIILTREDCHYIMKNYGELKERKW